MQTWSKASYLNKMKGFYRAFGGANDHTDPKLAAKVMHANPHIEPKNMKFKAGGPTPTTLDVTLDGGRSPSTLSAAK